MFLANVLLLDRTQLGNPTWRRSLQQEDFEGNEELRMRERDANEMTEVPLPSPDKNIRSLSPVSSEGRSARSNKIHPVPRQQTPKRWSPKPILIKAGFHRSDPKTENGDEAHVVFNVPDSSTSAEEKKKFFRIPECCQKPVLPLAGALSFLGGISFGYDVGIVSGMLGPVREHFHLSCQQEQVLVACLLAGALLVSLCGGPWIDKCGRRRAILAATSMFVFGSGLSGLAPNLDALAAGRLLQGFGMSLSAVAECIYLSEIAPKEKRGTMVGLNEIGITVGFTVAYIVDLALQGVNKSWRIMMAIAAFPVIVQMLGTFFFLPPSPREKMMNKCDKEAIIILEHLRKNRKEAVTEFSAIRHSLVVEQSYGTLALFRAQDNMLFRMLIGLSLPILQQLSGQPNILYYSKVVMEQVGLGQRGASLANLGLGIMKVAVTLAVLLITDRRGRRVFLITGCLVMSASMLVLACSSFIWPPPISPCKYIPHSNLTFPTISTDEHFRQHVEAEIGVDGDQFLNFNLSTQSTAGNLTTSSAPLAILIVNSLALMTYVAGYSIGFGPMVWLVLSELYPAGVKGRAMSFASAANWAISLAVSLTFLQTMSAFTPGGVFLIFTAVNLLSALYVFLVLPETKGKTLEKISYELRTTRPKQRFDENLSRLCRWRKASRTMSPSRGAGEYQRVQRLDSGAT